MRRRTLIIILTILASLQASAQPDTLWTRTFGGEGNDYGWSIQKTNDSGYIITGGTESFDAVGSDVWLIKIDSSGYEEWDQTYDESIDDHGYCVQQTTDGGYIITGQTIVADYWDVLLIKTDSNGSEEWRQTFG